MTKIVISQCYGGFGLSTEAMRKYLELKEIVFEERETESLMGIGPGFYVKDKRLYADDIDRDDPALVQTVIELADKAGDWAADLTVVEIPDDVEWVINEYDGNEWVAEEHRTWT